MTLKRSRPVNVNSLRWVFGKATLLQLHPPFLIRGHYIAQNTRHKHFRGKYWGLVSNKIVRPFCSRTGDMLPAESTDAWVLVDDISLCQEVNNHSVWRWMLLYEHLQCKEGLWKHSYWHRSRCRHNRKSEYLVTNCGTLYGASLF